MEASSSSSLQQEALSCQCPRAEVMLSVSPQAVLEQDVFHRSLLACCLEIVLFAYSSPRTFPWIIEVLDLRPFYFYKVRKNLGLAPCWI